MKTKKNMKKNLLQQMIFGATLLLAAGGCTQDELAGDGTQLPEGKYPLQIASVSLSSQVTEQPWCASQVPQTRVVESADGGSSEWKEGDKIQVQIGNGTLGTYVLNADGTINTDQSQPAYWDSKANSQAVKAWHTSPDHTSEDGTTVTLSDQSGGLAYVLKNSSPSSANFGDNINLTFSHALAKVRVVVQGDDASKVTEVKIWSHTLCTHTEGGPITGNGKQNWIIMKECNYNGTKCWEANVVPDATIPQLLVNGTETVELMNGGIKPLVAKINIITLTAGHMTYDLSNDAYKNKTINVTGKATIKGKVNTSTSDVEQYENVKINIYDGADVTFENVNIYSKYNEIITCKGNVTLRLSGTNTIKRQSNETAPLLVSGGSLTIEEYSSGSSLELIAAESDYGARPALCLTDGAELIIKSGKITANSKGARYAAGIGSPQNGQCGDITIEGGTIEAYGGPGGPGIGAAVNSTCGNININGGTITATGASHFDRVYGINIACGPGIGSAGKYHNQFGAVCGVISIGKNAKVYAKGSNYLYNSNGNYQYVYAYDIGPTDCIDESGLYQSTTCGGITIAAGATVNDRQYTQETTGTIPATRPANNN